MTDENQALWDVVRITMLLMMTVIIFGTYYDALFRVAKVETVECSYEIVNMAKKINVTLMGECEVVR
jgi:hypothetical protein